MSIVCLWNPRWRIAGVPLGELAAALLADVPRVAVEARGVIWTDARGLPAPRLARALLGRLGPLGAGEVRAGVSVVPVAAELAARSGTDPVTVVETGYERRFLAPLPLAHLEPDPKLAALLDGVGIHACGELAALERGAVEVRFGAAGASLWRLARADDPRLLFRPIPPLQPCASLDFVDYEVRDASALAFTANRLLESVCRALDERGELARSLVLELPLANRTTLRRTLRMARPTARQQKWLRRMRDFLDSLALPDAATGITLRVDSAESAAALTSQGDLFDPGFGSAAAAEEAVSRLIDRFGDLFVVPELSAHPLPEMRTSWRPPPLEELLPGGRARPAANGATEPRLELHLLPEPRPVAVRSRVRRDHLLPVAYLEGGAWQMLTAAAGPQRVSGGLWHGHGYAREYFRCVSEAGSILWFYRDAREGAWYLHGWWD